VIDGRTNEYVLKYTGGPQRTDCYETRGDKRIKAVLRVPEHRFFVLWGGLTHTTVE
jgi:hypothetical protein